MVRTGIGGRFIQYFALKTDNREINKRIIGIEHVFGTLKMFKILAERY